MVEFALFLPIFLLIISGVAEMGFYLNHYIDVLDATREGARYGADLDPQNYRPAYNHSSPSYNAGDLYNCVDPDGTGPLVGTTEFYTVVACYTEQNLAVKLDPSNGYDDIVISAFTIENGNVTHRFPWDSGEKGFSYKGNQVSRFSSAQIGDFIPDDSPKQGFMIVEILYLHKQLLALPFFTVFVPDDIPIHAYTLMPNATAGTVP